MRKILHAFSVTFFVAVLLYGMSWYVVGQEEMTSIAYAKPLFVIENAVSPEVHSLAWALFDVETGEVLKAVDAERVMPIASVSKLMTALVTVSNLDLSATTTVSQSAVETEGRAGRLKAGETMPVRELLFPLLLESSNDAAEALSLVSDRAQFMQAIQERAVSLGLASTSLEDPSGLSLQNVSTADDLARLLRYLYLEERHLLDITTLTHYVSENHDWQNNDPVVGIEGYLGGKHGYTPEAGRTFAGIFEETLADGSVRPVGIVLLDSDNIKTDVATLRNFVGTSVQYTSSN